MSQDSEHNLSPFVKKLKTASEEVNQKQLKFKIQKFKSTKTQKSGASSLLANNIATMRV